MEGAIRGEPSPEYAVKRTALVKAAEHELLHRAESAVLDNPFHRERRRAQPGGAIVDWNTQGVMLIYEMTDDDTTVMWISFLFTMKL